jgi:hypothetical protein
MVAGRGGGSVSLGGDAVAVTHAEADATVDGVLVAGADEGAGVSEALGAAVTLLEVAARPTVGPAPHATVASKSATSVALRLMDFVPPYHGKRMGDDVASGFDHVHVPAGSS